jgi:hypothetical protein
MSTLFIASQFRHPAEELNELRTCTQVEMIEDLPGTDFSAIH